MQHEQPLSCSQFVPTVHEGLLLRLAPGLPGRSRMCRRHRCAPDLVMVRFAQLRIPRR
jgi:hypothetical protein